jgi:hypothetical protein
MEDACGKEQTRHQHCIEMLIEETSKIQHRCIYLVLFFDEMADSAIYLVLKHVLTKST